jgi:hypothetical protein
LPNVIVPLLVADQPPEVKSVLDTVGAVPGPLVSALNVYHGPHAVQPFVALLNQAW